MASRPRPSLGGTLALITLSLFCSYGFVANAQEARPAQAPTLSGSFDGGDVNWALDGRIFLDAAFYTNSEKDLGNGAELRRARLGIVGGLHDEWGFQLDLDFADDEVEVKDAWLDYLLNDYSRVQIGSFKEPFSLEELTSSRYAVFMERSLPNVLAAERSLGISYSIQRQRWSGSTGVFGQEAGDVNDGEASEEGFGLTARLTGAPIKSEGFAVHLGVAGTYRTPDAEASAEDDNFRFRTRTETHVDRTRYLNTGKIKDVHHLRAFGLEAATAVGGLLVQGEYTGTFVERINGMTDADFEGWYVQASWLLGSKPRSYGSDLRNPGEFGGVNPDGSHGAWEFAIRHSKLRLDDIEADVFGGESKSTTLGVNWYANQRVRLMLNYVIADHGENADANGDFAGNDDFSILQLRWLALF